MRTRYHPNAPSLAARNPHTTQSAGGADESNPLAGLIAGGDRRRLGAVVWSNGEAAPGRSALALLSFAGLAFGFVLVNKRERGRERAMPADSDGSNDDNDAVCSLLDNMKKKQSTLHVKTILI